MNLEGIAWMDETRSRVFYVGIMAKVLSLMATHSGDRSQYFLSAAEIDDQLSNIEENRGDAGKPYRSCVPVGTS